MEGRGGNATFARKMFRGRNGRNMKVLTQLQQNSRVVEDFTLTTRVYRALLRAWCIWLPCGIYPQDATNMLD